MNIWKEGVAERLRRAKYQILELEYAFGVTQIKSKHHGSNYIPNYIPNKNFNFTTINGAGGTPSLNQHMFV